MEKKCPRCRGIGWKYNPKRRMTQRCSYCDGKKAIKVSVDDPTKKA